MLYTTLRNKNFGAENASWGDPPQVTPKDVEAILEFCSEPRSRSELMDFVGLTDRKHFTKHYLKPLLETEQLTMTLPDKPNSSKQKYLAKK